MAYLVNNGGISTLASGVTTTTQTTVTVASGHGARFPSPTGGDYTLITLENAAGTIEIVSIVGRSTDVLTVGVAGSASADIAGRGVEGTTATTWVTGDIVEGRATAAIVARGGNAKTAAELAAVGGAALIGNTAAGTIVATTVQAAIDELATEKAQLTTLAAVGGAALIGNTAAGNIVATTVQAAINELDTEKAKLAGDAAQAFAASTLSGILNNTAYDKYFPVTAPLSANTMTPTLAACFIDFRTTTLTTGVPVTRTVASTITTTISSGSTGGTVSAVASTINILAIDYAGTVELAWCNATLRLDESTLISTTAEGGVGGADSASVIYSTTARSNVAFRVVGYVDSTQTTAGSWAQTPTLVQGYGGAEVYSSSYSDSATVAGIPQNSKSAAYTTVLADANKHILHPTADNNARTFTIDSNANVAYPIGTTITFVNQINTVTIAITTDTMTLAGSGSTGSRTLAAYGIATAIKVSTTGWVISGAGLS